MTPSKKPRPQLFVLNDPYPMRISAELAQEIGFNESIILLQLEYLISISKTEAHDDELWTYQSLAELQNCFPWWSLATIDRAVASLETQKLIKVGNYNKRKSDRTRWFALDCEGLAKLKSVRVDRSVAQAELRRRTKPRPGQPELPLGSPGEEIPISQNEKWADESPLTPDDGERSIEPAQPISQNEKWVDGPPPAPDSEKHPTGQPKPIFQNEKWENHLPTALGDEKGSEKALPPHAQAEKWVDQPPASPEIAQPAAKPAESISQNEKCPTEPIQPIFQNEKWVDAPVPDPENGIRNTLSAGPISQIAESILQNDSSISHFAQSILQNETTLPETPPETPPKIPPETSSSSSSPGKKSAGAIQNQEEGEERSGIRTFLREHGIFPKIIAELLALDYSDDDLRALLTWCENQLAGLDQAAELAAGRFVARARGGVTAPAEYYQPPCPRCSEYGKHKKWCSIGTEEFIARERARLAREEAEEEFEAEASLPEVAPEITRLWEAILGELKEELPRASFDTWVRDTQALGLENGELRVAARNSYARDWLERRLTTSVTALLPVILASTPHTGHVQVTFVVFPHPVEEVET